MAAPVISREFQRIETGLRTQQTDEAVEAFLREIELTQQTAMFSQLTENEKRGLCVAYMQQEELVRGAATLGEGGFGKVYRMTEQTPQQPKDVVYKLISRKKLGKAHFLPHAGTSYEKLRGDQVFLTLTQEERDSLFNNSHVLPIDKIVVYNLDTRKTEEYSELPPNDLQKRIEIGYKMKCLEGVQDLIGHFTDLRDRYESVAGHINIAHQLNEALAHLNQLGIVHRDAKLGNILIDRQKNI